jgi:hypothetical protein
MKDLVRTHWLDDEVMDKIEATMYAEGERWGTLLDKVMLIGIGIPMSK